MQDVPVPIRGVSAIRFDRFTLDLRRGCLYKDDIELRLRPKSFASLRYLVEHADRLVEKAEIIGAVWPDVNVTDESLARCISDIRHALGDHGHRLVRTVPCRGYRLAASVHRVVSPVPLPNAADRTALRFSDQTEPSPGPIMAPPLSIVVLPFLALNGDRDQQSFADGMTEDLTTELSQLGVMFVVSRSTAFTYRNRLVAVRQVGRELGVRYVLEGSVRRASSGVRVCVHLIDAERDAHLWGERFDCRSIDLFALQDQITMRITNTLVWQLVTAEAGQSTGPFDALDYIARGQAALEAGTGRKQSVPAPAIYHSTSASAGSDVHLDDRDGF